jgi:hypothetical protein
MEGMNATSLGTIEYSSGFQCFHHTRLHGDAYDTDRFDMSDTLIILQLQMVLMCHNLLYNILLLCVLILLLCVSSYCYCICDIRVLMLLLYI